jgi:hypothetical protein
MNNSHFEFKFQGVEGKAGHFSGYGSIFGVVDRGGDLIEKGAFSKSLEQWKSRGKLPKMLLQHGGGMFGGNAADGIPVGKYTEMLEDDFGLRADGFIDPIDTDEGKKIYAGLKNGELDGLSIGYVVKRKSEGSKASGARRILHEIDIHELSIVTFPMNEVSLVDSVKSQVLLGPDECRALETILRTKNLSQSDAKKAVSGFKQWLQRDVVDEGDAPRDEDSAALNDLLATIRGARSGL